MIACFDVESDGLVERIRTAVDRGDAAELADAAHRLSNTLVYLGAAQAEEAVRRIEKIGKSGDLSAASEGVDQLILEVECVRTAIAPHRKLS